MGRHSAARPEQGPRRSSLVDTTLTKLRKIHLLPANGDNEQNADYGVDDDPITDTWLQRLSEDRLPNFTEDRVQNWEYCVYRHAEYLVSGYYSLSAIPVGGENDAAACILGDWLNWNGVSAEHQKLYEIQVRRVGHPEWNGYAEGRQ